MDINKLKAFVAVCNTGSYTKVAKSFGYTHAGISYMIKSLKMRWAFPFWRKREPVGFLPPMPEKFCRTS